MAKKQVTINPGCYKELVRRFVKRKLYDGKESVLETSGTSWAWDLDFDTDGRTRAAQLRVLVQEGMLVADPSLAHRHLLTEKLLAAVAPSTVEEVQTRLPARLRSLSAADLVCVYLHQDQFQFVGRKPYGERWTFQPGAFGRNYADYDEYAQVTSAEAEQRQTKTELAERVTRTLAQNPVFALRTMGLSETEAKQVAGVLHGFDLFSGTQSTLPPIAEWKELLVKRCQEAAARLVAAQCVLKALESAVEVAGPQDLAALEKQCRAEVEAHLLKSQKKEVA